MRTWKQLAGIGLCATAIAVGVRLGNAWSAGNVPAAGPERIAVVNLNRLLSQLKEHAAAITKVRAAEAKFRTELRARRAAMKQTQELLSPSSTFRLKPDTRAFRKAQTKLLKESLGYRSFVAYNNQRMLLTQSLELQSMYREINLAIARYAKKHNITLVLMKDPTQMPAYNAQALQQDIANRKVLYASRSINITTSLVERMNAAYLRANPH